MESCQSVLKRKSAPLANKQTHKHRQTHASAQRKAFTDVGYYSGAFETLGL